MVVPVPGNTHTILTPTASPFPRSDAPLRAAGGAGGYAGSTLNADTTPIINDPIRRAKQVLGKTGDFWALVDMVRNVASCSAVLDDLRDSEETLRALVKEQRQIEIDLGERTKAHADATSKFTAFTEQQRVARDKDTMAMLAKTNDLNLREEVIKSTEMSLNQRETALAARESRLAKDAVELDAKANHDTKAVMARRESLQHEEAAFAERVAAFERRFQAAKAILAAVPDAHEVATTVIDPPSIASTRGLGATVTHAASKQTTNPH